MWCHYNNSVDNGAIYGKLYNWFAVKLLQMDIDYYNADNPSATWGWRVPTQADFDTLATTLGGASVAGGKLKLAGTTYWNSPNTGADNSSGFSAICVGIRDKNGGFTHINSYMSFWTLESDSSTNASRYELASSSSMVSVFSLEKIRGYSLRLIRATT